MEECRILWKKIKIQRNQENLIKNWLKEKLKKQNFNKDLGNIFDPSIDKEKNIAEETTKAITTGNGNWGHTILEELE